MTGVIELDGCNSHCSHVALIGSLTRARRIDGCDCLWQLQRSSYRTTPLSANPGRRDFEYCHKAKHKFANAWLYYSTGMRHGAWRLEDIFCVALLDTCCYYCSGINHGLQSSLAHNASSSFRDVAKKDMIPYQRSLCRGETDDDTLTHEITRRNAIMTRDTLLQPASAANYKTRLMTSLVRLIRRWFVRCYSHANVGTAVRHTRL